ncbi:MAG: aldehyde dehydrogenase (NADP(+)) [Verrucomicrobiota bacterium]
MSLHGKSILAGHLAGPSSATFQAISPLTGQPLEPTFHQGTPSDVDAALQAAENAFQIYSALSAQKRAEFLEKIAEEILALGDELLQRTHLETGLPLERLTGERGRTMGQLRLFAEVIREGSWIDARIDTALPDRQPLPRPDLRRMMLPLGPVVVFGASNFPLAFSVAGGDTASALAAGCPVVVKGHPAHPGASELVAGAITKAAAACGLPAGVFSLIHGTTPEVGLALAKHPAARAVGFTGSHRAGRALFDAANSRPEPIPVFAEMSSLNPLIILPGALAERGAQIAEGLKTSVTMGVGQFCTKPGLIFAIAGEDFQKFIPLLQKAFQAAVPATMLHGGICASYHQGLKHLESITGVQKAAASEVEPAIDKTQAEAVLFITDSATFRKESALHEELFGPQTLLVTATDEADLLALIQSLNGQLTATVHGTTTDLAGAGAVFAALQQKAGRLVVNGFPTGVEVSPAMQHGGPYPATTDARFTSVGSAAIQRWARPVCFQNFPATALPEDLQDANPRGVMRLLNGQLTRAAV